MNVLIYEAKAKKGRRPPKKFREIIYDDFCVFCCFERFLGGGDSMDDART